MTNLVQYLSVQKEDVVVYKCFRSCSGYDQPEINFRIWKFPLHSHAMEIHFTNSSSSFRILRTRRY